MVIGGDVAWIYDSARLGLASITKDRRLCPRTEVYANSDGLAQNLDMAGCGVDRQYKLACTDIRWSTMALCSVPHEIISH